MIESGDYSGPAGARRVLREPLVEAAILETARGGILRRGIAVSRTDVAVETNVSSDHFGEFGIDDLAALAAVALSIPATTIAQVDNPGRLMRFEVNGAQVLVNYAHNPDGLWDLRTVARQLLNSRNSNDSTHGRLGLLLGHAGNRRSATRLNGPSPATSWRCWCIRLRRGQQCWQC